MNNRSEVREFLTTRRARLTPELAITAEPGLVLLVYTAEPGSPSAERLRLLASWAATAVAAESPDETSAGPLGDHR
jgi:hypothetical protein